MILFKKRYTKSLHDRIIELETGLNRYINELSMVRDNYTKKSVNTDDSINKINCVCELIEKSLDIKYKLHDLLFINDIDTLNTKLLNSMLSLTKEIGNYNDKALVNLEKALNKNVEEITMSLKTGLKVSDEIANASSDYEKELEAELQKLEDKIREDE